MVIFFTFFLFFFRGQALGEQAAFFSKCQNPNPRRRTFFCKHPFDSPKNIIRNSFPAKRKNWTEISPGTHFP